MSLPCPFTVTSRGVHVEKHTGSETTPALDEERAQESLARAVLGVPHPGVAALRIRSSRTSFAGG